MDGEEFAGAGDEEKNCHQKAGWRVEVLREVQHRCGVDEEASSGSLTGILRYNVKVYIISVTLGEVHMLQSFTTQATCALYAHSCCATRVRVRVRRYRR